MRILFLLVIFFLNSGSSFSQSVPGYLGKRLSEICPGDLNKSFFTLCGATSIENGIKLARLYTGRHKILSRYQSYHGATMGVISAGGDPRKLPVDAQQSPNFVHFDLPYLYRWEYGEENLLKEAVAQFADFTVGPAHAVCLRDSVRLSAREPNLPASRYSSMRVMQPLRHCAMSQGHSDVFAPE